MKTGVLSPGSKTGKKRINEAFSPRNNSSVYMKAYHEEHGFLQSISFICNLSILK